MTVAVTAARGSSGLKAYLLTVLFELQALVRDRLAETQGGGSR